MRKPLLAALAACLLGGVLQAQNPSMQDQLRRQQLQFQQQQLFQQQLRLQQQQQQQLQRLNNMSASGHSWNGNYILSLHAGTGFFDAPDYDPASVSRFSAHTPLFLSLRCSGEHYLAHRFFWGWQGAVDYSRLAYDYRLDGDSPDLPLGFATPTAGSWLDCTTRHWALGYEQRLSIGYDISYAFSLNLSVGIGAQLLSRSNSSAQRIDKATAAIADIDPFQPSPSLFAFDLAATAQLELLYYFSSSLVASCAAKVNFGAKGGDLSTPSNPRSYALLLGVGYKFYVEHNATDDD
ncbi:MAG: hypothetical protein IJ745_00685 [Bacteroidales bacterium]|nr:hypothetical protein [Bacteroidales bacterium]